MTKQLFFILAILFVTGSGLAQDATPTTPPMPKVTDTQNVKPENLQGVPAIAPKYQSDDKKLPDLGRVGVDMLNKRL